jgi:hypothetical protein
VWDKINNSFFINEETKDVYFDIWQWTDKMSTCLKYPIEDCIFQQYTGLKDKNGKEIYEGDIIRGMFDFGPAGFTEEILPINWHSEKGYQWEYWQLITIEVVGNIFQYPCKPDHNGECIICDCWLIDCPILNKSK